MGLMRTGARSETRPVGAGSQAKGGSGSRTGGLNGWINGWQQNVAGDGQAMVGARGLWPTGVGMGRGRAGRVGNLKKKRRYRVAGRYLHASLLKSDGGDPMVLGLDVGLTVSCPWLGGASGV